jgi:hypothetical protein
MECNAKPHTKNAKKINFFILLFFNNKKAIIICTVFEESDEYSINLFICKSLLFYNLKFKIDKNIMQLYDLYMIYSYKGEVTREVVN